MRRQLLISMLAVAVAAVLALGIPLGFVLARLQVDEANQALHRDAQSVAADLYQRNEGGLPIDSAFAGELGRALVGRYVVIRGSGHVLARTGARPASHDFFQYCPSPPRGAPLPDTQGGALRPCTRPERRRPARLRW